MAGEGDYKPPKGHDRHLNDSERAHSGAVGAKVRHGQDALGLVKLRTQTDKEISENPKWDKMGKATPGFARFRDAK